MIQIANPFMECGGESPVENSIFPTQVAMVLSALDAGHSSGRRLHERRASYRCPYRAVGSIRLFSDETNSQSRVIYTRDVGPRGLGFITAHRLPLGYGGLVQLPDPSGEIIIVHGTLLRCREAVPGWFEGSLYFNREQTQFRPQK